MSLIPNNELVARAWLIAAVSDLSSDKVATTLADPPWPDNEFVQIMQVGGSSNPELPVMEPVVSVNCFAFKPGSAKPPWGQANHLASAIWKACYAARYNPSSVVLPSMPSGYGAALIRSVYPVSLPRRVPSDPSQYAVYNLDVAFSWVPSSEVFA